MKKNIISAVFKNCSNPILKTIQSDGKGNLTITDLADAVVYKKSDFKKKGLFDKDFKKSDLDETEYPLIYDTKDKFKSVGNFVMIANHYGVLKNSYLGTSRNLEYLKLNKKSLFSTEGHLAVSEKMENKINIDTDIFIRRETIRLLTLINRNEFKLYLSKETNKLKFVSEDYDVISIIKTDINYPNIEFLEKQSLEEYKGFTPNAEFFSLSKKLGKRKMSYGRMLFEDNKIKFSLEDRKDIETLECKHPFKNLIVRVNFYLFKNITQIKDGKYYIKDSNSVMIYKNKSIKKFAIGLKID